MNECKHEWKVFMIFKPDIFALRFRESRYSYCVKCRLLKHDNDDEIFTTDLDFHTEKRKGLKK